MRFKKRPVIVECIQFIGGESDLPRIINWLSQQKANIGGWIFHGTDITIPTLEGNMKASPGDWIIRGVNGEFYPCKPDIFEKTYEPAE